MQETVATLSQKQKITCAELSQRAGINEERLTAIIEGRWTPSPSDRESIAAVFGVRVDEVLWHHINRMEHMYGF